MKYQAKYQKKAVNSYYNQFMMSYSVKTGEVPVEWKRAHVVPQDNCGIKATELCLAFPTTVMCKLCEKILKREWVDYLDSRRKMINGKSVHFQRR